MHILLVDDHVLFRETLREFLGALAPEATVLEAGTLAEAKSIVDGSSLDLVLLDLDMPGVSGLAGLENFRKHYPNISVAILSGSGSRDDILGAIKLGARGFIPKTISGKAMLNALRLILSGETYIPLQALEESSKEKEQGEGPPPFHGLTTREKDVLGLLVKGYPNKKIANALGLREVTVKVHLQGVFRKLGVSNRAEAVATALALGWVPRA